MHWNHRIVRKNNYLGIHEAYYNECGHLFAVTTEPVTPYGEELDELRDIITWMAKALESPVLEYDEIGDIIEQNLAICEVCRREREEGDRIEQEEQVGCK